MMTIDPQDLAQIAGVLQREGFHPLSSPEERHGSWEWPFHRHFRGLDRFAILAVTPGSSPKVLDLEIWIGAQSQSRFTRRLSWSQAVDGDVPSSLSLPAVLGNQLRQAAREAISLPLSSLTEALLDPLRSIDSVPSLRRSGGR